MNANVSRTNEKLDKYINKHAPQPRILFIQLCKFLRIHVQLLESIFLSKFADGLMIHPVRTFDVVLSRIPEKLITTDKMTQNNTKIYRIFQAFIRLKNKMVTLSH